MIPPPAVQSLVAFTFCCGARADVDANVICPLLKVAAIAFALLQAGMVDSSWQAITNVIRAGSLHCPVRRSLCPGSYGTNKNMLRTIEARIQHYLPKRGGQASSWLKVFVLLP